jgi:hypothetical protein
VTAQSYLRIRLDVADVGPNLDSKLQLWRRSGSAVEQLAEDASNRDLGGTIERVLAPGTYFVHVRSNAVLKGDVGRYTLRIEPPPGLSVTPPPGLDILPLPPPAPPGLDTQPLPPGDEGDEDDEDSWTTGPGRPGTGPTAGGGSAAGKGTVAIDPQPEPPVRPEPPARVLDWVKAGPQPVPPTRPVSDWIKADPQPEPPTRPLPDWVKVDPQPEPPARVLDRTDLVGILFPVFSQGTVKTQMVTMPSGLQTGLESLFVSPWRIL